MAEAAAQATTEDAFLDGRLVLRQPLRGHRAGGDALLLAAAVPEKAAGPVVDFGAGVGAAALSLAALRPELTFSLVEKEPKLAAFARQNIERNGFATRGTVYEVDGLDRRQRRACGLTDGRAGLVISNPPFHDHSQVRPSPDADKRDAHVLPPGITLQSWTKSCFELLADGGFLIVIHRPDSLKALLDAFVGRGGDTKLLPIHPSADRPAVRILLRTRKGSKGPLSIAPALILNRDGRFTEEADAIHRGRRMIAW